MLKKIKDKLIGSRTTSKKTTSELLPEDTPVQVLQLLEEYDAIKSNPLQITGRDFDRAFEFLEKHPESDKCKELIADMNSTNSDTLKGLSYPSAMHVLEKMPDHLGAKSIMNGIYKVEKDYIPKLTSDVISFILEIAPDHPQAETLVAELVNKNFTNAYLFVTENPEHPHTQLIIRSMFQKDANIAVLLLKEKMDHPQVGTIIDSIYEIRLQAVKSLSPDAILFVLDVAPDHKNSDELIAALVQTNHIKAFEFIKEDKDNPLAKRMTDKLIIKKPELATLVKNL